MSGNGRKLRLACMTDNAEDLGTVTYLADCAAQAGLETAILAIGDRRGRR